MDVLVKGRHCEVSERFRSLVEQKAARLEKHDARVIRLVVEVSRERNPRLSDRAERVELTVHSRGPVIRAEAAAADKVAALDVALERLQGRLRRVADRRRVHHGARTPESLARAMAKSVADGAGDVVRPADEADRSTAEEDRTGPLKVIGDGPPVVREKVHRAEPMALDQALYEMELVGHDFYLFVDRDSGDPSVVYRRRGYDYGVIRLAR